MTEPLIAAGIDAGQRYLDVGFAPEGKGFRVANDPGGIAELVGRLMAAGVGRVVLEAIGVYARAVTRALGLAGFAVGVVNPRRIKAFREAEGRRAKTDRLDAALIARFALRMSEAIHPLPDPEGLILKALATRRRQLVDMIAVEKTRLKQAEDALLADSHRAVIALLGERRAMIEAEIAGRLAADPHLARTFAILTSVPGIGPTIATVLICDLPELGRIDRKRVASLAGLAPQVSQSGNMPPRAAISGGRPCVRAALYMAALVAVRHDPPMRAAYQALREAAKPPKVALVAIARRILITANALAKAQRSYQPPEQHA
jgi:transposase